MLTKEYISTEEVDRAYWYSRRTEVFQGNIKRQAISKKTCIEDLGESRVALIWNKDRYFDLRHDVLRKKKK